MVSPPGPASGLVAPDAGLDVSTVIDVGSLHLDVSFTASPGATVAILGANGAGKTTLLRLVAGLWRGAAGHVRLGDLVLDDSAVGRFVPPERRPVAMVFQDFMLFPHLSALDNIAFGLRCRQPELTKAAARDVAQVWLERVDLAGHGRSKPGALSAGQAQRVALARALATDPKLLLLDEPLAALDASTRSFVRSMLAEFPGITLVVSHDHVDARTLADHVIVLDNGSVAQAGHPADVLARPRTPSLAAMAGLTLLSGEGDGTAIVFAGGLSVPCSLIGPAFVALAPSRLELATRVSADDDRDNAAADNTITGWPGRVSTVTALGERLRVEVATDAGGHIVAVDVAAIEAERMLVGRSVLVRVPHAAVAAYA